RLTLQEQASWWTLGYELLMAAAVVCALCAARAGLLPTARDSAASVRLQNSVRWRWVLLALVPSSLMLSVTSYLTTDIAAIPLLWVIPLGIYLLTFTLVFA